MVKESEGTAAKQIDSGATDKGSNPSAGTSETKDWVFKTGRKRNKNKNKKSDKKQEGTAHA